ncbi:MAG: FGGY-family carbohydrate kinase, partial [Anaerolineaceae bacterium]
EELANSVPDTGGVYMEPAFVGFSAPYWQPDARAAIVGMTPSTRRAHVVRAALESIDFLLTDVLNLLKKESGVELSTIHADGGATRNHFLMQFLADNSRLIVRVSGLPELSALGAVMSGGLGLGIYSSMEDLLSLPTRFIEYQPQMEISRVEALNQGWQKAVSQILYKG